MGLRVIIGYPTNTRERPFPVYVGASASEAAAARASNTSAAHFDILENPPSYRKTNVNHRPEQHDIAAEQEAVEAASGPPPGAPASLAEFGQRKRR